MLSLSSCTPNAFGAGGESPPVLRSASDEGGGEEPVSSILGGRFMERVLDIESLGFSGCWMLIFGSFFAPVHGKEAVSSPRRSPRPVLRKQTIGFFELRLHSKRESTDAWPKQNQPLGPLR